jgi:hypothetical protein
MSNPIVDPKTLSPLTEYAFLVFGRRMVMRGDALAIMLDETKCQLRLDSAFKAYVVEASP